MAINPQFIETVSVTPEVVFGMKMHRITLFVDDEIKDKLDCLNSQESRSQCLKEDQLHPRVGVGYSSLR